MSSKGRLGGRVDAWSTLKVTAIRLHDPSLALVVQRCMENLPESLAMLTVFNRHDRLDALFKVSMHPVGRSDKEFTTKRIFLPIAKVKNPRMLKEAANDRDHSDCRTCLRHAGSEDAKAANDQVDLNAGLRRAAS